MKGLEATKSTAYVMGQIARFLGQQSKTVVLGIETRPTLPEAMCALQKAVEKTRNTLPETMRAWLDDTIGEYLAVLDPNEMTLPNGEAKPWTDEDRGRYFIGYYQSDHKREELTVTEASMALNISRQAILDRLKKGTLQGHKDEHGRYVINRSDLESWQPQKTGPKQG